jgi:hypothetical protein
LYRAWALSESSRVQAMLRLIRRRRYHDAKLSQARRPDGDEERGDGFDAAREVGESGLDEVGAR